MGVSGWSISDVNPVRKFCWVEKIFINLVNLSPTKTMTNFIFETDRFQKIPYDRVIGINFSDSGINN